MTSLEEMLEKRPVDQARLAEELVKMHLVAELYKLQEIRKDLGITQVDLAHRLGVSQKRVSQIEKGEIESTSVKTLSKYVEALGANLTIAVETPDHTMHKIYATAS